MIRPTVYILQSQKDGNKYIGSTIDLEKRLTEHNTGKVKSTKNRQPLILIGYQEFNSIKEAANKEKYYKRSHDILLRAIKKGDIKLSNIKLTGRRPEGSARRVG